MNSARKYLAVVALTVSGLLSSSSGDIIVNDATITNLGPYDYCFTLTQSVSPGGGLFAVSITNQGSGTYELQYAGIAEEYALFTATSGEMFTPSFVQTNTPFVSNNGNDPGSGVLTFDLDESKYLAYWDDRTFGSNESGYRIPNASDNYGWAILYWDGIELSVTESATALGGGIIVGTTTQIPEPSTCWIAVIGGLVLFGYHKRKGIFQKRSSTNTN